MSKHESLTTLRIYLTELYKESQDIKRIAEEAGLNLAHISLNQSPINLWHNILIQAHHHERVEAIVKIASEDYLTWAARLQHAYRIYLTTDETLDEREFPPRKETKRSEVDFYPFKIKLASILNIFPDEISLLKKIPHGWQVEMPLQAAERLVLLNKENSSQIHSLGIRSIEIIERPSASFPTFSDTFAAKDTHTFQIALQGNAIPGNNNELKLLIGNISSTDYKQVRIHLQAAHHLITLAPVDFRLTDFKKNSTCSLPIKIHAVQAGSYEIQVRASSIPAPTDGFLRATLQLIVEAESPKYILKIELS